MAVSARFLADWTSFYDAVDKADLKLVTFQDGARNAESALNKMTDNFSGRKLIQEATVMAEAVERAGGISKLTASELERVSSTAAQAAAKMKALGEEVPPSIDMLAGATSRAKIENDKLLDSIGASGGRMSGLSDASVKTTGSMNGLTTVYHQFDGVLQSVGINIGPQVKGIEDIANAATGASGKIGGLASAGLVLGTGIAAWGITRAIMEFLDLDKSVEKAWRTLLGYGDAAAEVAGAKQDVINRAIANGAKETISYKDAIQFNIDAVKKNADAHIDWSQKLSDAQREVRNLTDAQKNDITIAQEAGASTEKLTNKFHISAEALKILAAQQRDAAAATDEHRQKMEALDKAYDKLMSDTKNANQLAIMEADSARMAAEQLQKKWEVTGRVKDAIFASAEASNAAAKFEQAFVSEQQTIDAENARLIASHAQVGETAKAGGKTAVDAAQQTTQAYAGVAQQITLTGDAIKEYINLMRYTAQANAILQGDGNSLFTTQSQRERVAAIPSFASGVENFAGGVALVHKDEALVNLPSGTSVIPAAGVGGAGRGGGLSVSIVANTIVSTREEISEMIRHGIADFYRATGTPLPSGGLA